MPSQGFHGLVAASGSYRIMWSLPPPIVVYSSHDLYGWNHRIRSGPSTFTSVCPSLYSHAGCTSATTPSDLHRSRLNFDGKFACVMQNRKSLIGVVRLTNS